jgi:hypothetical protein
MYETPQLIEVGKAEEVILGVADVGNDLDTRYFIPEMEYASDE